MIGDTHIDDGVEFEVIWEGGEGLVAERQTKVSDTWTPPLRQYNKTGKHTKKAGFVKEGEIIDCECVHVVDNGSAILDDIDRLNEPTKINIMEILDDE